MKAIHTFKHIFLMPLLAAMVFGCAGGQKMAAVTAAGPMDNPQHLCFNGQKLLAEGKTDAAMELFKKALAMDSGHIPSMLGMSEAHTALGYGTDARSWGLKALKHAKRGEDRLAARTTLMKIHLAFKPDGWLKEMESIWQDIRKDHEKPALATLLMGRGYQEADRALEATVCYRQVLAWNTEGTGEADRRLEALYRQLRAEPGTHVGRTIAGMERVSRGDAAALVIEELKLQEYLEAAKPKTYDAGFKTPRDSGKAPETLTVPTDIAGHAYEKDILTILQYGIRGLEPFPDGSFQPAEPLSRANFALVVEEILVRIKNEPLLKNEFIGNRSPFPDVAKDHYAFNAMFVCTTRNFLAADLDGAFRPEEPVTGAECLLAVRRLKEAIKSRQINY